MVSENRRRVLVVQASLLECLDHVGMTMASLGKSLTKGGEAVSRAASARWAPVMSELGETQSAPD